MKIYIKNIENFVQKKNKIVRKMLLYRKRGLNVWNLFHRHSSTNKDT